MLEYIVTENWEIKCVSDQCFALLQSSQWIWSDHSGLKLSPGTYAMKSVIDG